jgi:hypothetical protein
MKGAIDDKWRRRNKDSSPKISGSQKGSAKSESRHSVTMLTGYCKSKYGFRSSETVVWPAGIFFNPGDHP